MKAVTSTVLRELDVQQRMMKIYEMRHEMLQLRLRAAAEHVPAFATRRRALRKSIARALTVECEFQRMG